MEALSESAASACPKCGYVRQPADRSPAWQCARCGVAMEKFLALARGAATPASAGRPTPARELPRLSFAARFASALPDLGAAWLFAWCWKNPLGWTPNLTASLAQVMLMQFFVVHSSVFLSALVSAEDASRRARAIAAVILIAFYIPVAGGFAWFHDAWWPFAAFAWLLLSQLIVGLLGRGPAEFEKKRLRYYWGNGAAFYIVFVFVAVFLPMPRFGFSDVRVPWSGWKIPPQEVIAWGFLYFSALAALKLFEKAEWIDRMDEPADEASP